LGSTKTAVLATVVDLVSARVTAVLPGGIAHLNAGAHVGLSTALGYVGASVVDSACLRLPVSRAAVTADGTIHDTDIRAQLTRAVDLLLPPWSRFHQLGHVNWSEQPTTCRSEGDALPCVTLLSTTAPAVPGSGLTGSTSRRVRQLAQTTSRPGSGKPPVSRCVAEGCSAVGRLASLRGRAGHALITASG